LEAKAMSTDGPVPDRLLPDGRFAPGNRCSPGNPNARRIFELRRALLDSIDAEAVGRIGRKLVELAEGGDLEATKVLFSYVLPKPTQELSLGLSDAPRPIETIVVHSPEIRERAEESIQAWRGVRTQKLRDMLDGPPEEATAPAPAR
jgi:hypothetical protein